MATKTSAVRYHLQPLRRRTHIVTEVADFETAAASSSFSSVDSRKNLSAAFDSAEIHQGPLEKELGPLFSDDSDSQDEHDESGPESTETPSSNKGRGLAGKSNATAFVPREQAEPYGLDSQESRPWYRCNFAIVLALVSPIGNWLTGTDYIKSLLLIALLAYYLHQIIEVPWQLYQNSRPRQSPFPNPAAEDAPDQDQQRLAISELRSFELAFLFLTIISPILGALLLRYATTAFLGAEYISWFSTTLFVLAAGMRPWSHLIDRIQQRTTDLHDTVHYRSSQLRSAAEGDAHIKIDTLDRRVENLEGALVKLKSRMADSTERVYEHVDEAVEAIDRSLRKLEKRGEKLEARVEQIMEGKGKGKGKDKGKERDPAPSTIHPQETGPSLVLSLLPMKWLAPEPNRVANNPDLSSSTHSTMRSFPSSSGSARSSPSSASSVLLDPVFEEDRPPPTPNTKQTAWPCSLLWFTVSSAGYLVTLPLRVAVKLALGK